MKQSAGAANRNPKARTLLNLAIVAVAGWYLLLCAFHLLSLRPLWNDEACVFESIKEYSPYALFHQPLKAVQVFPRVYLFLIQTFSSRFNFDLASLRLASFMSMIAAFFLWLKIASYEFKEKRDYLIFVLCWASSAVLIYYSAELKQYSMDVLAGSIFILFLYKQEYLEKTWAKGFYLAILAGLPGLLLFSYPVMIFLLLPLYNLFLSYRKNPATKTFLLAYGFSCVLFLGLSFYFDMRLRPLAAVTQGYGDYFISLAGFGEFFKTFGEGTCNLFFRWFVERPKLFKSLGIIFMPFGIIYMFYGFVQNIKKDSWRLKSLHTIALIIYLGLFLLGVLKKYPFTVPRTSLFFAPIAFFLMIKGIGLLKSWFRPLNNVIQMLLIAYLIFISAGLSIFIFQKKLNPAPEVWRDVFPTLK